MPVTQVKIDYRSASKFSATTCPRTGKVTVAHYLNVEGEVLGRPFSAQSILRTTGDDSKITFLAVDGPVLNDSTWLRVFSLTPGTHKIAIRKSEADQA